jgi:ribonucleoside-triphosphate reductase
MEGHGKPNHKKKLIFPKLVFIHNEEKHNESCEYEYLFNYAIKCSSENMYPDYIGKGHRRNGKIVSPMG